MQSEKNTTSDFKNLQSRIQLLEERMDKIERILTERNQEDRSVPGTGSVIAEKDFEINFPFAGKGSFEIGFGEYGMAWIGNIVLLFGITFLVQNLHNSGNVILSVLIGYAAVAFVYFVASFTSKTYSYLSKLLLYNGHIILYILTLRLYFFQKNPVMENPALVLLFLLGICTVLFVIAYRKKFRFLAGLVFSMALFAGIASNLNYVILCSLILVSALTLFVYYKFNWIKVLFVFITLTYIVFLNWLLNNPFITKEAVFRENIDYGMISLYIVGSVFSLVALIPQKEKYSSEWTTAAIILNGMGFTTALILMVVTYFTASYIFIFSFISLFCLLYSILLKKYSSLKIAAPMYAIYGFVALSTAIYGIFLLPGAYLLLSVQSFLVVSMALWFRSRFLVITNTLLFLLLLILYISDETSRTDTDFSFLLVAFVTARVLNWRKERLNLKTDFIRNLYLLSGFAMTLIAFHRTFPPAFITISWIGAAILFFILGLLINNKKYRWLAIATMIASAVNLLFVDIKNMNISLRIIIFLVLAVISIAISVFYTRHSKKKNPDS